jgi:3-oxoacyl-[acyl-carrier-protein] synthase II
MERVETKRVETKRRVVITGAGVLSSLGDTPAALHEALCAGRTGLGPVSLFELDGMPARRAGEIPGFDPETYLGKGNFRPLDRTGRLAAAATHLALAASGRLREERGDEELGLVLGTMFGSVRTIAEFDRRALEAGPQYVKPFDFANSVINAAAGQAAIWHGLRGLNSTVAGGATAGLQALASAADYIRTGRADVLVAGGVEELCFEALFGFSRAGWLAPGDGEHAVPLEARRNGFLLGEGAALFVLEEEEAARRRGATVLAEVLGHGSAFDVSRGHDPERAARAVSRSLVLACEDAGVDRDEIDAASLAANGSVAGDRHEAFGFAAAFGERARRLPATAVKSALGETLGAAGALQTLVLVEAMARGVLPGIAGLETRDPELPLEAVSAAPRELGIRRGIVHALGLDGATCALVIGKGT